MSKENIPFQVQQIIDGMLNAKDNVYIRANYRNRLDTLRSEIDKAIRKYDNELYMADMGKSKKKRA